MWMFFDKKTRLNKSSKQQFICTSMLATAPVHMPTSNTCENLSACTDKSNYATVDL